jgi:hypothetical protein
MTYSFFVPAFVTAFALAGPAAGDGSPVAARSAEPAAAAATPISGAWRSIMPESFQEVRALTLGADGAYVAEVSSDVAGVPAACDEARCAVVEAGRFAAQCASDGCLLELRPGDGRPARTYGVKIFWSSGDIVLSPTTGHLAVDRLARVR